MLSKVFLVFVSFAIFCESKEPNFRKFVEGSERFAAKVYTQVSRQKRDHNFLVCPFSAEAVLGLAQNGARGRTRTEIRQALNLPNSTRQINTIFKNLLGDLKDSEDYTFQTANKIYVQENYPLKENFLSLARNVYQSPAENIDFGERRNAAKTINDWVSEQTKDQIRDLITSESLEEDTVAVLVNALYFQANWRKNFKKTLTHRRDFFRSGDDIFQVETMKKGDYYGYYESEDLDTKILQVPFRGRNASMVIVLPNQIEGLKQIEERIREVYSVDFKWEFVDVLLPKFKIETSIDFKKILKNLGVKKAFTRADFSGMAGEKGEVYISDVVQKAFISVNEDGVEAAAATAITYHPKSLMEVYGEKKVFIADHPFLFYIKINDVVIFTGRVISPST